MKDILLVERKKPFKLMEDQNVYIECSLKEIFENKKVFTQAQYSLSHLSAEIKLSTNQLSAFFNQNLGLHFNDYINKLRVDYFLQIIESDESRQFTLAGLAERCGFHNRNTFTSAFKKFMGTTPSKYMRKQVLKSFSKIDSEWLFGLTPLIDMPNESDKVLK